MLFRLPKTKKGRQVLRIDENKLKIRFWLNKSKTNQAGLTPIYVRLTVNMVRAGNGYCTQQYCKANEWNAKIQKVTGSSNHAKTINSQLKTIENDFNTFWAYLELHKMPVTADVFRQFVADGRQVLTKTIEDLLTAYLEREKERVKAGEVKDTLNRVVLFSKKLTNFLMLKYKRKDIALNSIKESLFDDLKYYLINDLGHHWNYASKLLSMFKDMFKFAKKKTFVNVNVFEDVSMARKKDKQKPHITPEIIQKLIDKQFARPSDTRVKEIFLFCCFTGLRWSDYDALTEKDFVVIGGKQYIDKQAEKGESQDYGVFFVPTFLHPFVGEMIEKYGTNNLPKLSNQKINKTLKALQTYVDEESTWEWTHHTARRTFIHWCRNTLHHDTETVQVFVGHSTEEQLNEYAMLDKTKVINLFRK